MTRIALYDPHRGGDLGIINPRFLQTVHWMDAAREAEAKLREFLELGPHWGLVLMDRATHVLGHMVRYFMDRDGTDVILPRNTYRAAYDVSWMVDSTFEDDPLGNVKPTTDAMTVPTPLWGQAPFPRTRLSGQFVVMDCAHVCYPGMFANLEPPRPDAFWSAVLSFFPTKPCGAFGGGALILPAGAADVLRNVAWPITKEDSSFDYPATVQSVGLMRRLEWEQTAEANDYWFNQRAKYQALLNWLRNEGFAPLLQDAPIRPHLLPVYHTPRLERLCQEAELTYGRHYPSLPDRNEEPFITIPFWTDDVLKRLQAQTKVKQPA